jgi:hypothetical protein
MYRRDNQNGFGRLEHDDPKPLRDTFSYKVSFQTEDFAQVPGPGAFSIAPLYPTEAPIAMLVAEEEEEEVDETACFGGTVVEEYVFELSDEVEVLAVPKNVTLSAGAVSYRATYSLDGRTLTARRELVDSTDRNVCPIAIHREWVQLARKIMADLKAQVVYR